MFISSFEVGEISGKLGHASCTVKVLVVRKRCLLKISSPKK